MSAVTMPVHDEPLIIDWDEYGQAYDRQANLVVCVCGAHVWKRLGEHYCPYDEQGPSGDYLQFHESSSELAAAERDDEAHPDDYDAFRGSEVDDY